MTKRFNVRVYGVLLYEDALLVSDEFIKKNKITKFPGGGLEFGEGTRECLKREFQEELKLDIEVGEHFYTTDFHVTSAFDTNSQVISIYYFVHANEEFKFKVSALLHDYECLEGSQSFRWIKLKDLKENDFTLIIDRKVGEMLMSKFEKNS